MGRARRALLGLQAASCSTRTVNPSAAARPAQHAAERNRRIVMSDPTPEAAASRIAEIDADLAAKRSDDPGREALLNEKLKWYPFAHPSTPTTPPTGPAREVRGAARTGFRSNFRALQDPSLPEGHTDRRLIIDEMIAQANVAHAPGGRGPEINLPFDVVQNPGIAREREPPVELGKLGALRGDAQWDIRALEDGQAAADDLGISDSFEAIAHTVQRLHHEGGRRWNAETSAKELESRYGAGRGEGTRASAEGR